MISDCLRTLDKQDCQNLPLNVKRAENRGPDTVAGGLGSGLIAGIEIGKSFEWHKFSGLPLGGIYCQVILHEVKNSRSLFTKQSLFY